MRPPACQLRRPIGPDPARLSVRGLIHHDTMEVLRKLRSAPHMVRALVDTAAPAVLEQGARALDPTDTPAYATYQRWLGRHPLYALDALPTSGTREAYEAAIKSRLEGDPKRDYALAQFAAAFDKWKEAKGVTAAPSDGDAAKAAYDAWRKKFPGHDLEKEPDWATATRASMITALGTRLDALHGAAVGNPPNLQDARVRWLAEYEKEFAAGTTAFLEDRRQLFGDLVGELEKAGFEVIPRPLFGRWKDEPPGAVYTHLFGMLMTTGLLTLGAPFWFNLLKNMMSLRPAVARLIERRPQSSPALPPAPPNPPAS